MDTETRFTARIPSDDYAKLRVVAAMRGESINLTLCDAVDSYLSKWEEDHGAIPTIQK
jgi:glutamine synthetase type III